MTSELVATRRRRVLDAMSERGVDALVLGRQDNVGYSTGMAACGRLEPDPSEPGVS